MTPNLVNVTGLVFDLVGAGLVVFALAFAKSKIVKAQSLTVINGNPVTRMALLRQRQDALFGLLFLSAGFLLQIVAALGACVNPSESKSKSQISRLNMFVLQMGWLQ